MLPRIRKYCFHTAILEALRESQRSMQGRPRGTTAYSLDRCIILNGKKKENRVRGSAACCRKVQSHKQGSFSLPLGAQGLEASRKPKPPKQPISVYKIAPDELVCSRILRSPHSSCRFRAVRNFSVNHLQ